MNNDKIEYLKNELKNYNYMKQWLKDDSYVFDDRIAYYERKIHDIDIELSSGNAKGIDYGYIPTSAVQEPLLALLSEQEEYIKRRNELIDLKNKDIYGFKARVEYIEECLNKLDEEWQRNFVKDIYCCGKSVDEVMNSYPFARATLYRFKDEFILEMGK